MTRTSIIALSVLIVAFSFSRLSAAGKTPTLSEKIVTYCRQHVGEKVGDGECSSLGDHALKECGGAGRGQDHPNQGDYVWGDLVYAQDSAQARPEGKRTDIKPGDIIQLRDVKFAGKQGNWTYSMSFSHHTAVVNAIEGGGATIKILHQNYNGKRVVMEAALHPADLKEGWLRVYRPVAKAGK